MPKVATVPFDVADYLNSDEDVAAYLDAWLEDGSPDELRSALEDVTRSRARNSPTAPTAKPPA